MARAPASKGKNLRFARNFRPGIQTVPFLRIGFDSFTREGGGGPPFFPQLRWATFSALFLGFVRPLPQGFPFGFGVFFFSPGPHWGPLEARLPNL